MLFKVIVYLLLKTLRFLGIANKLILELESSLSPESQTQLRNFYKRVGANREAYRKKDFTGNSVHRILKNVDTLSKLMQSLEETDRNENICEILWNLGQIQSKTRVSLCNSSKIFFRFLGPYSR